MDIVVCPECRGATSPLSSSLSVPPIMTTRTWHECSSCGWESPYGDSRDTSPDRLTTSSAD